MPLRLPLTVTNPDFMQRLFAYQQTKRLHLLIDQILWSFDQLAQADCAGVTYKDSVSPYLRRMLEEIKGHVETLDKAPYESS